MPARKRRGARAPRPAPRSSGAGGSRRVWLGLAAVLVLTCVLYLPSLRNGFTNWDDNYYVTENPLLAHPTWTAILTTPVAGNYHPLTMASLLLNYRISGLDPGSYHLLNLLLHLANTALVFLLVWLLSERRFWTSVVVSGLFGIHPMHVESVAWIAERKDVLYAFFYLVGLIAYLRYRARGGAAWYGATLLLFVLSLASKPAAAVFPVTLLAIDYLKRRPIRREALLEKAPFFAVSIAGGLLTLHAQRSIGAITAHWGAWDKLLFACYGVVQYVAKLFVPVRLSAIYPYPGVASGHLGPEYVLALPLVALLLPGLLYLFRRNRVVLFGLAFFFIHLVLVLQFFAIGGAVMADRYTYLPYIGLFFALAYWLDDPPERRRGAIPWRPALAGVLLLVAVLSAVETERRIPVWRNAETLWNDTIGKYPHRIPDAYNDRGYYYQQQGRYRVALADFDEALALNGEFQRAWVNKGTTLASLDRPDSAVFCFDRALAITPGDPDVLNDRGAARARAGDLPGAVADYTSAIEGRPDLRVAYTNRAVAYLRLGEYAKSIADNRRAITLDPADPGNYLLHGSIGVALHLLRRDREALPEYDRAIAAAPAGEALLGGYYLYRSYSRWAAGDTTGARSDARAAAARGAAVPAAYLERLGG